MLLSGYESIINVNKTMIDLIDNEIEGLKAAATPYRNMDSQIASLESRKEQINGFIKQDEIMINAYKSMKENMIKLRKLSKIVPRDRQDGIELSYEKSRREEEIIASRKILTVTLLDELHREITALNELEDEQERESAATQEPVTPVEPLAEQEPVVPVSTESEQEPVVPVATESEQEPVVPVSTEPEQEPTVPVATEPEQEPVVPVSTESEPEQPVVKKGLVEILNNLTQGLEIKPKTGKKYVASNVKCTKQFLNEINSGNYLYNIVHFIPATIKTVALGFKKLISKFTFKDKEKEDMATLEERVNNLTEADIEIIFEEYRGNRVQQEKMPSAINILLQKKINEYVMNKVTALNSQIDAGYRTIFSAVKRLEKINADLVSTPENATLINEKNVILSGKAELIQGIRKNYVDANKLLNAGLHGFDEDMKAAATKLSYVGKRFAKDNDLNHELLASQADIEKRENSAIANGDNEGAIKAFIENEVLLSNSTEIAPSFWGKRSVGDKYYSPLASAVNYNNDPFVRDVLTTIALVGAGFNAVNAINTQSEIAEINNQIGAINQANQITIDRVNGLGQEISDKQGVFQEGMQAQAYSNVGAVGTGYERYALDSSAVSGSGWSTASSSYKTIDEIGHTTTNSLYTTTQTEIESVVSKYAAGSIDQAGALSAYSQIANNSYNTLNDLLTEYQSVFEQYVATHPQYELEGLSGAIDYLVNNPDAITNMNQGMVDVVEIGNTLSGLTIESFEMINNLPSSVRTSLFGAITAATLATKVSTTMSQNARSGKYGNSITDLVSEYAEEHRVEEETPEQTGTTTESTETPEQTGATTESTETPEQTGATAESTETPEQTGETAESTETPEQIEEFVLEETASRRR